MAVELISTAILINTANIPKGIFPNVNEYFGPQIEDFNESSLAIFVLSNKTGFVPTNENIAIFSKSQWLFTMQLPLGEEFEFQIVLCSTGNFEIKAREDGMGTRKVTPEPIQSSEAFVISMDWDGPHTTLVTSQSELFAMDESLIKSHYEHQLNVIESESPQFFAVDHSFMSLEPITEYHEEGDTSLVDSLVDGGKGGSQGSEQDFVENDDTGSETSLKESLVKDGNDETQKETNLTKTYSEEKSLDNDDSLDKNESRDSLDEIDKDDNDNVGTDEKEDGTDRPSTMGTVLEELEPILSSPEKPVEDVLEEKKIGNQILEKLEPKDVTDSPFVEKPQEIKKKSERRSILLTKIQAILGIKSELDKVRKGEVKSVQSNETEPDVLPTENDSILRNKPEVLLEMVEEIPNEEIGFSKTPTVENVNHSNAIYLMNGCLQNVEEKLEEYVNINEVQVSTATVSCEPHLLATTVQQPVCESTVNNDEVTGVLPTVSISDNHILNSYVENSTISQESSMKQTDVVKEERVATEPEHEEIIPKVSDIIQMMEKAATETSKEVPNRISQEVSLPNESAPKVLDIVHKLEMGAPDSNTSVSPGMLDVKNEQTEASSPRVSEIIEKFEIIQKEAQPAPAQEKRLSNAVVEVIEEPQIKDDKTEPVDSRKSEEENLAVVEVEKDKCNIIVIVDDKTEPAGRRKSEEEKPIVVEVAKDKCNIIVNKDDKVLSGSDSQKSPEKKKKSEKKKSSIFDRIEKEMDKRKKEKTTAKAELNATKSIKKPVINNLNTDSALIVNDDYKFPDSVTPTKVEHSLSDLAAYDVPFMDDDTFHDDWKIGASNTFPLRQRHISSDSNLSPEGVDVQMKYTPRASVETLQEDEQIEKAEMLPERSRPPSKRKGIYNLCGCVRERRRS